MHLLQYELEVAWKMSLFANFAQIPEWGQGAEPPSWSLVLYVHVVSKEWLTTQDDIL